ncbi:Uu.00g068190.m01.CDS01 [Anthostomella pinea]|uniref:Uu.00g068190.m01.CDS01 n=1 Tax=Anthostomella pinea TaxID=933095 RepID=A0AAI8YNB8_9PEZI|nr:Uu.00g068190.m01.CDS01 [Anthostomella pinea]
MPHPLRALLPSAPRTPPVPESSLPAQHRAKRAATAAACEACRKRKSKCNAARPRCSGCVEKQTACEYRTRPTETHPQAQKRKLSDLELRCQAYEDLFNIVRSRPDHDSLQILERIRSGIDIHHVLNSIHDGDLLLELGVQREHHLRYEFPYRREMPLYLEQWQNPYLKSHLYGKMSNPSPNNMMSTESLEAIEDDYQKSYLIPYHAADLVDPLLAEADVASWTNVSSNNTMLRRLLEIYFVSEYPFHPYFLKEAFVEDLVAGNRQFCSPLLVNAVLAAAWVRTVMSPVSYYKTNLIPKKHGYRQVRHRAEYWKSDNLGCRFLSEARRLLEVNEDTPALTTVQATAIIGLTCNTNGIDVIGWSYLRKAIAMAHDLKIFAPSPTQSASWQSVAAVTAWCLYNWQALAAYHTFQQPLLQEPPQYPLPDQHSATDHFGELFLRYPNSKEPIPMAHGLVFRAVSELRIIINDIARQAFKSARNLYGVAYYEALMFRSKLTSWYTNLAEPLRCQNISLPCHLKLHIHYHVMLISLFEPFEAMRPIDGEVSAGTTVKQSRACFETLIRLYYQRHGFESYDPTLLKYLHMLGFSTLRDLGLSGGDSPADEDKRATLVLCAKGMWEQGRNSFASEAVFHMLRHSMGPDEIQLINEFTGSDRLDDRMELMAQEIRSQWPIGAFNGATHTDEQTLEHFLKSWEKRRKERSQEDGLADGAMDVDGYSSGTPSPTQAREVYPLRS